MATLPHTGSNPHLHNLDNPFSRPQTPHHGIQLAFCGLGAMGYPMAKNLANRHVSTPTSNPILIWNRSRAKCEKLLKELGDSKIKIADSLEEVAKESDMVFTNLANDVVVKDVYFQFARAIKVRYAFQYTHDPRLTHCNHSRSLDLPRRRSL